MKTRFCLIDADYIDEEGRSVIRLFGKDSKGRTIVALDSSFRPYFYILPRKGKEKALIKRIEKRMEKEEKIDIEKIEVVSRILDGEKRNLVRISCQRTANLSHIRDIIKLWERERGGTGLVKEEYEYSINFYRRYLIDKSLEGMGWVEVEGTEDKKLKKGYHADAVVRIRKIRPLAKNSAPPLDVLAFDIESFEEGGKNKIIMMSFHGKSFRKVITYRKGRYPSYVEIVKNEEELLKRFIEIINRQDPDVLVAYNSDEFDFQMIQERADSYKLRLLLSRDGSHVRYARRARISTARLKGRMHIDIFQYINNILSPQLQTETLTLNAVASELLGDKKIELKMDDIYEAWRKNKDLSKLAEYNLKDSELTYRLAGLILPQIYEISRLIGQLPFDTSRMTYSQLVEWYLSKRSAKENTIMPNQPKWNEIEKRRKKPRYVGGYVQEPVGGIHENIAVLDFRSLYPSIIASHNISPETLGKSRGGKIKVPGMKHWFSKSPKGFVSSSVKGLIETRAKVKSKMKHATGNERTRLNNEQFAMKTIANASYGSFAFSGAKWYCYECAESSAAFGRYYIKKVIEEAKKSKLYVIYGDTDSLFVTPAKGKIEPQVNKFLKKINRKLPGMMELDIQGIYMRGIFIPRGVGPGTAKKRYALIDKKGSLLIRGLERVRKDWCDAAKMTQEKVIYLVLAKKDVEGAIKYVQSVIRELKKGKIPLGDLVIHEQLTKPLSEYKATTPHVVVARKIKKRGRPFGPGMDVAFAIVKGKGKRVSDKAEPIEDVNIKDVDVTYYTNKQIVPAALRILKVLDVDKEELLGEKSEAKSKNDEKDRKVRKRKGKKK